MVGRLGGWVRGCAAGRVGGQAGRRAGQQAPPPAPSPPPRCRPTHCKPPPGANTAQGGFSLLSPILASWGGTRWAGLALLLGVALTNSSVWQVLCALQYRCVLRLQFLGQLLLASVSVSGVGAGRCMLRGLGLAPAGASPQPSLPAAACG